MRAAMFARTFAGTVVVGATALVIACGSNPREVVPDVEDGSSSGSSGASGSSGTFTDDGGRGEGGGATAGCSADLRNVVDGAGAVTQSCPPEQGCAAGKCVPACDAAAASKGSLGCTYVVATPSFNTTVGTPCFAVFLANGWSKAAKISVSRGGTTYDATRFARTPIAGQPETAWPTVTAAGLAPGEVAVLFMSAGNGVKCPVETALPASTAVTDTGKGQAWSVSTDVPVTAYDILPYGGAKSFLPSAELLFPTTAWGTNYVAMLPPVGYRDNGPFWGQVVASEDNTSIDILPSVALPGGAGVAAAAQNVKSTYVLNAGEYIQFQGGADMSGSVLSSTKPISFTGGNGYICYKSATSEGGGCDSAHQATPPVSAMGHDYVAAPWVSRSAQPESIAYRILAPVAGTQLTYDPPISGAPATLGAGELRTFEATEPFRVKSQDAAHPVLLTQMMSGCIVKSGNGTLGDEEFVNVVPPEQFLQKYVFFTDPSYGTTTLALTRLKTGGAFKDVSIKCLGTVTGWKPVGTSGDAEVATVDLVRNGQGLGTCKNGSQTAESEGRFGITVWGLDVYASYAYPAGGNAAPINTVVVVPVPK